MAADMQGKWITTDGYAEVEPKPDEWNVSLRFSAETPVYHHVILKFYNGSNVEALVASPENDSQPFELHGSLFDGGTIDGTPCRMILLTDGSTVLGLSYGPRSHQKNNF